MSDMVIKCYGRRIDITRELAVARAHLAAKNTGFRYKLGAGGRNPNNPLPYSTTSKYPPSVDCSGFVAWCLGYDRCQVVVDLHGWEANVWVNTDEIHRIATFRDLPLFRFVKSNEPVLPGDLLNYPGKLVKGEWSYGHVGIVVDVGAGFVRGEDDWWKHVSVAHATPKHRVRHGNVVAITDARIWRRRGYFVRYLGFAE